jgi:hypothetical protein
MIKNWAHLLSHARSGSSATSLCRPILRNRCQTNASLPFHAGACVQWTNLLVSFFLASIVLSFRGMAQEQARGQLPAIPRGVFCLEAAGQPADQQVLNDPYVDGMSIRQRWTDFEKSKGVFDWSFFDSEIAKAEKAGKPVLVRILTEGPSTPQWVYDEGVQTFAYQDTNPYHEGGGGTGRFALYWDKTYLAEKKAMIAAAGRHLSSSPAVKIIWAVLISSRSGDWHVPHSPADIEHWHAVGYSPEKLVDVCRQIIDTTVQSFPNQYVAMAVGPNGLLDSRPNLVGGQVVQYARSTYSDRAVFQRNSLSAVTPLPSARRRQFEELLNGPGYVAGQMLWFTYGDPTCRNNGRQRPCDPEATLRKAIDIAVSYRMRYVEIYRKDVVSLPSVIRYAHEVLTR